MIELIIFGIFSVMLLVCILFGINIIFPLVFGLLIFFSYGLYKKHSFFDVFKMCISGIVTIKNLIIIFILIGIMTAFWRSSGTIAFVVYYASLVFSPDIMVIGAFVVCSIVSMLMGTSMGTVATIGVICMTMSNSMGIPVSVMGGAIFAGIYFGDRCSPMSSSALLVSELTKTNIFDNIKLMLKTATVPLIISLVIYTIISFLVPTSDSTTNLGEIFLEHFSLNPLVLIPAATIILLSIFRFNVKINMVVSILSTIPIIMFVQNKSLSEIINIALFGFHPDNSELSGLISGGGIVSMSTVIVIVCLSCCYAGIFKETNFLDGIKGFIVKLSEKTTVFTSVAVTSIIAGMISCNQTLAIMLTNQLCKDIEPNNSKLAVNIENTAVILAPMVPWSIACTVPLSTISAPTSSLIFAFYLYLIPIWQIIVSYYDKNKQRKNDV